MSLRNNIKNRLHLLLVIVSLMFCMVSNVGCANSKSKKINTISQASTLLDLRKYTEAIQFINNALNEFPEDLDLESLLANAYIGKAGIELLPFVELLMGNQTNTPLGLYQEPVCPTGSVKDLAQLSLTCFFYRLARNVPQADHPDILSAQQIYRKYFPDPSRTSVDINFTAGVLETLSAVTRFRALLKQDLVDQINTGLSDDPHLFPFEETIHHTKRVIDEVNWAVLRFRYSYNRLNGFMTSLRGTSLFTVGNHTLRFDSSITYSSLVKFASLVLRDMSLSKDRELSNEATNELQTTSGSYAKYLCAIDPACVANGFLTQNSPNSNNGSLGNYLATKYTNDFVISFLGASNDEVNISLFQLAWMDPPPLIQSFLAAAKVSWETESGDPLRRYFDETEVQWRELRALSIAWDHWLKEDMTLDTQQQVWNRIALDSSRNQDLLSPPQPEGRSPSALKNWFIAMESFINYEAQQLIQGSVPESSLLVPTKISRLQTLIKDTNTWMNQNFYPVSDWATLSVR